MKDLDKKKDIKSQIKALETARQALDQALDISNEIQSLVIQSTSASLTNKERMINVQEIQSKLLEITLLLTTYTFNDSLDIGLTKEVIRPEFTIKEISIPEFKSSEEESMEYCTKAKDKIDTLSSDILTEKSKVFAEEKFLQHISDIISTHQDKGDIQTNIKSIYEEMALLAFISSSPLLIDEQRKLSEHSFATLQQAAEYCAKYCANHFEKQEHPETMSHNIKTLEGAIAAREVLKKFKVDEEGRTKQVKEYFYTLGNHLNSLDGLDTYLQYMLKWNEKSTEASGNSKKAYYDQEICDLGNEIQRTIEYSSYYGHNFFDGNFNAKFFYDQNLNFLELQLPNLSTEDLGIDKLKEDAAEKISAVQEKVKNSMEAIKTFLTDLEKKSGIKKVEDKHNNKIHEELKKIFTEFQDAMLNREIVSEEDSSDLQVFKVTTCDPNTTLVLTMDWLPDKDAPPIHAEGEDFSTIQPIEKVCNLRITGETSTGQEGDEE